MKGQRNLWLAGLLGLLLGACGVQAPRHTAQIDPGDESGIGGTGILASESGLGGTGIVGEITGFGSIFVNGAEVELSAQTSLTVDGEPVARHAFAVGEVVALRAESRAGRLEAAEAHVRHEVIGPVTRVARGRIEVLGQPVRLAQQTQPRLGAWVAVSGFRAPDGVIHATRIAPARAGTALVVGTPQAGKGGWRIGNLRLQLPGAPAGGELRLRGHLRDGLLVVSQRQAVSPTPFRVPVKRLLIQGFVRPQGAQRFAIDGLDFVPAGNLGPGLAGPLRLELQHTAAGWRMQRLLRPDRLPLGRPTPAPMRGGAAWPGARPAIPGRAGMGPGMPRR